MSIKRVSVFAAIISAFLMMVSSAGAEDPVLKPYVLAWTGAGTIGKKIGEVKTSVTGQGFQVWSANTHHIKERMLSWSRATLSRKALQSPTSAPMAQQCEFP